MAYSLAGCCTGESRALPTAVPDVQSVSNPHDALFKAAFSHTKHAAGLLRCLVPGPVAKCVNWRTLRCIPGTFVDIGVPERQSDLLFSARLTGGKTVLLYLVEHQSEPDPRMAWRLYEYVARIWAEWEKKHPAEPGLPAVIPIVVHHGAGGWRGPTSLTEMYSLDAETGAALSSHLPELRFVLDDLGVISMAELEQRPMTDFGRLVLLCLQRARVSPDMVQDLARWLDSIGRVLRRAGGRRAVGRVVRYILRVTATEPERVRALLEGAFGQEGREAYMTGADILEARAQADILLRQLTRRFGTLDPATVQRVRSSSKEQLVEIADRVVTADSLREVFAKDSGSTS